LKDVVISPFDRVEYGLDVIIGHVLVKKVAHGIHEDHAGRRPSQRSFEKIRLQCGAKLVPIAMLAHRVKSASHAFRIAEFAPGADLRAARNRIPSGVSPLNL
jgi:hypothetical protein